MRAIRAEFAKLKGSRAPLWTALVVVVMVALGLIGAVAFGKPETIDALKKAGGAFAQAASAGLYTPNWKNMLRLGPQAVAGSWGVLVFSFVTAYVFGREFKEGTDSAMLTTPVRRETVVLAKMIVLAAWVFGLAALSFLASVTGFAILGLDGFSWSVLVGSLADTAEVTLLIYLTLPVVALLAVWGKGYLWPMLFAVLAVMMTSTLATSAASLYIPWSMPIHIAGASWLPITPKPLTAVSWLIAVAVFILGLDLTVWRTMRTETT